MTSLLVLWWDGGCSRCLGRFHGRNGSFCNVHKAMDRGSRGVYKATNNV